MKILAIHKNLSLGGGEDVLIKLEKIARKLGHAFDIAIFEDVIEFDKSHSARIIPLLKARLWPGFFKWLLSPIFFIRIFQIARNYDFLLSFERLPALFTFIVGKTLRKKIIIYVQTPLYLSLKDIYKNSVMFHLQFLLQQLVLKNADLLFAVGEGVKMELIKKFDLHERQVVVLPPLLDIDLINTKCLEKLSKEEKKIFNNKTVLISIGRLAKEKNQALLINSFSRLKLDLTNLILIIVGSGPEKEKLINLISNLKLKDKVYLLGPKKNPYKYLVRSRALILSSKFEGFPQVLLESLYLAKFVISLDSPYGPREILISRSENKNRLNYPYLNSLGMLCVEKSNTPDGSLLKGLELWTRDILPKTTTTRRNKSIASKYSLARHGVKFFNIIESHA